MMVVVVVAAAAAVVVLVLVVVVVVLPVIYLCETYHISTLVLLNIPLMCNLKSSPCQNIFKLPS